MFELPARMTHLQANIRAGEVSVNDALVAQLKRGQSLNAKFPCVVEEFPLLPPHDGPLAGIALAHKDIFQLNDRMPGCGVGLGLKQSGIDLAAAMTNLQQAGASQWAALVMAPYACGATSQNAHFARCINPTDANAAVGGSSSGSAVAGSPARNVTTRRSPSKNLVVMRSGERLSSGVTHRMTLASLSTTIPM